MLAKSLRIKDLQALTLLRERAKGSYSTIDV